MACHARRRVRGHGPDLVFVNPHHCRRRHLGCPTWATRCRHCPRRPCWFHSLVGGVHRQPAHRGYVDDRVVPSFGAGVPHLLGHRVSRTGTQSGSLDYVESLANARRRRLQHRPRPTCCHWRCSIVLSIRRVPPFLAILGTALFSGIPRHRSHSPMSSPRSSASPIRGRFLNGVEAIYSAMANGHVASSTNATINDLFSRWRHVKHAHHGVADPRRAQLRRDHGTRGVSRAGSCCPLVRQRSHPMAVSSPHSGYDPPSV